MVFALELKLSKTLRGLVYFVPYLYGGRSPPYNCNTKYTSLLRVFDNFNSKVKTLATLNYAKIESSYGFCFGIEAVKNSEWACIFCTILIWGAKPPPITAIQNTQAPSEFLTTSIPKQKPTLDTFNFCKN